MKRKIAIILALFMSFAILLTSCGGGKVDESNAGDTQTEATPATADKEDKAVEEVPIDKAVEISDNALFVPLNGDVEQFNPILNNYSRSSKMLLNLYSGLFKFDENGEAKKAICKDYTIDETGTKYTFELRQDAKWSDGSPVTAHDFEYAWKEVLTADNVSKAAAYNYILKNGEAYFNGEATADEVGVKAIDDYTLEVELEYPKMFFEDLLCGTSFMPVKKDNIEKYGESWTKSAATMVSNGPFHMQELSIKNRYVMGKNPHYYDADNVKLDQVVFLVIEAEESILAAYMSDEIQVSTDVGTALLLDYKGTPDLHTEELIGVAYYDLKVDKEPLVDPQVRKALSMAIDRQTIIDTVMLWPYKPAFGIVPYGIPDTSNPGKDYRETAGDIFSFDIEGAQQLMADAGYPNGEGFPKIKINSLSSAIFDVDIAQMMQGMWKENLGIDSEIEINEGGVHWDILGSGDFEVFRDGYTGDIPDPLTLLDQFIYDRQYRQTNWQSDKYEELIKQLSASIDPIARIPIAIEAEKLLMDEMPIIPIYFYQNVYLVKENVKGIYSDSFNHLYFENASIEK